MNLPFNYEIDEENKVILIHWGQNGQLGRYVVPVVVKENFPGYTYKFVGEDS